MVTVQSGGRYRVPPDKDDDNDDDEDEKKEVHCIALPIQDI